MDLVGLSVLFPLIGGISDFATIEKSDIFIKFKSENFLNLPESFFKKENFISFLAMFLGFVFILKFFLSLLLNYLIFGFSTSVSNNIRLKILRSILDISYLEFSKTNSSEYMQSVLNLGANYKNFLENVLRMVSDGIIIIVILGFLFYLYPIEIVVFMSFFASLGGIYIFFFKAKLDQYSKMNVSASVELSRSLSNLFRGVKELRILRLKKFFENIILAALTNIRKSIIAQSIIIMTPKYLFEALTIVMFSVFIIFSYYFGDGVNESNLFQTLAIFGAAAVRLLPTFTQVVRGFNIISFNAHVVDIIFSQISLPSKNKEVEVSNVKISYDDFSKVSFQNVSFGYDISKNIFSDLSFEIHKKDIVGISGKSGSGKTTLVDILLGLIQPNTGRLVVNTIDLKDCLSDWQNMIAYLPQELFLIEGTIEENIALGIDKDSIDSKKLSRCIEDADLGLLVASLSEGIESIVGENGINLSGGQRQRIALARAFYFDRDIIIFDESTSSLDKETEDSILNRIYNMPDKTIIIISHNPHSLENCNIILSLKSDGSIHKEIKG